MKDFLIGLLVGSAIVYWSGYRSDAVIDSLMHWMDGAADNYQQGSEQAPAGSH